MERRWRGFAEFVVNHVGVVLGVVVAISAVLAVTGIPQLEFATGQDSYLNDDEQTAIDNVEYQDLFGGQAMLTLFTMDEGTTVVGETAVDVDAVVDGAGAGSVEVGAAGAIRVVDSSSPPTTITIVTTAAAARAPTRPRPIQRRGDLVPCPNDTYHLSLRHSRSFGLPCHLVHARGNLSARILATLGLGTLRDEGTFPAPGHDNTRNA